MKKWTDPIKESKAGTASAWGKNRELARKLLMKSKLYRASALFFAVMGVVILIQTFLSHIDGHFMEAMKKPATIVLIVMPFLPAVVLSLMAQKAERDFAALKPFERAEDKAGDKSGSKGADTPAKK